VSLRTIRYATLIVRVFSYRQNALVSTNGSVDRLYESDSETAIWETDQPDGEVGSVLEVSPTVDSRHET
jgi:hypothetical protein